MIKIKRTPLLTSRFSMFFMPAAFVLSVLGAPTAYGAKCTYEIETPTMQWTGYKFNEKVGVKGGFDNIDYAQKKANSVAGLFKSIEFTIDTASVNSNNISRDKKLALYVFGHLLGAGTIRGKVVAFDEKTKKASIDLSMNGKQRKLDFSYKIVEGKYVLNGVLSEKDILALDLKSSFDRIHEACKELHIGKDGKSVTWKEVGLEIQTSIKKECA